ncbi:autoinducer binding domain-containing protein [Pseudomonas fluorescens]|jgi:LuxR family quorum-sensing system transcriptional regulator SolR|uniref:Quorum-sensing control repressor n=1 Tax=Pseudomonas fluorescens TaxID=294 RepID=A0A1X9LXA1_PSEFL|nr:autoinducer binding domain-containing protein [Pseudomonas fluorescens]AQZ26579.1 ObaA [Pseudomonas fluorescens]ARJ35759.1 quorum-sensing control repressor [Pseudomonas fluorescens]MBD8098635.1 autoinducer binding domain-containing protein [Pseudomonas fluorescens]MBD8774507.1 autoinducer binding domain-containing protein [Pseudomonas fluorescens]MBD8780036.1 autoinducer binding domain-containing protein [Pseudomonas fluorescens]
MNTWKGDMWNIFEFDICEQSIFKKITATAQQLGFDHCAYGLQLPLPLTAPKVIILDNYPDAWRARYSAAHYVKIDPAVLHGRRTQDPLVWSASSFSLAPELWEEANAHGIKVGWSQSHIDLVGAGGMLSVSRCAQPLSPSELADIQSKLVWLVSIAHSSLSRAITHRHRKEQDPNLTFRELEVLKWTADGKSAGEISDILTVSKNTIDFHIKNAILKLKTCNKTAAVVRAAMLGLLV